MTPLNKYDDFMLELLVEKINQDETVLVLSRRLLDIIRSIDHPIAYKLLRTYSGQKDFKSKVTLLDISNKKDSNGKVILDNISYMMSNKALEYVIKNDSYYKDKEEFTDYEYDALNQTIINNDFDSSDYFHNTMRTDTSFGRLIKKIYPGEFFDSGKPDADIESFINQFKAKRDTSQFELVKGSEIVYWYNERNYAISSGGDSLHNSCMCEDDASPYIEFYAVNPEHVSLLILKDGPTKIRGRAIVWKLDIPEDRTFMDRVYTIYDSDVILFKDYATQNGWLFKEEQSYDLDTKIIDSKTGEEMETSILLINNFKDTTYKRYPFMDTLLYYDGNSISNKRKNLKKNDTRTMRETDGFCEFEFSTRKWSEYYEDYIDMDEMIYCEYSYNSDDDYRYEDDCVVVNDGEYATKEYAEENFTYSEYSEQYFESVEYSDYHDSYINKDDAVSVYTDAKQNESDYRLDDDDTWFTWDYDNEKYDNDVELSELYEVNGLDENGDEILEKD